MGYRRRECACDIALYCLWFRNCRVFDMHHSKQFFPVKYVDYFVLSSSIKEILENKIHAQK